MTFLKLEGKPVITISNLYSYCKLSEKDSYIQEPASIEDNLNYPVRCTYILVKVWDYYKW